MKIKFKCSSMTDSAPKPASLDCLQQVSLSDRNQANETSVRVDDHSKMSKSQYSNEKFKLRGSNKRASSGSIECLPDKRQRMNRTMSQQCSALLKSLMGHPLGWPFIEPVDPAKLNIPDYFSIISKPMDLGSIKSRLQKNFYADVNEFAEDIRLTFSNAIRYNPPNNKFHKMAVELNEFFESRWKFLGEKCDNGGNNFETEVLLSKNSSKSCAVKRNHVKTLRPGVVLPKRLKPSEAVMTCSLNEKASEVKVVKPVEKAVHKLLDQNLPKGTDGNGKRTCGSNNMKQFASKTHAGHPTDACHATSDISSERSSGRDQLSHSTNASKLDCEAKTTSEFWISKSDPDSDGAISSLDDENIFHSSKLNAPTTVAASGEEWKSLGDAQLSPAKALRAAMVKHRFADTILKAQQKTLLDKSDKTDPSRLQREKEEMERRQREEKARLEAQIRAAEAASRMREEIEFKKQREREREAARSAIEKMEKTANIELNLDVLKELEKLCGCSLTYNVWRKDVKREVIRGTGFGSPLEQLGLYFKEDDHPDEILNGDEEEGEILCF